MPTNVVVVDYGVGNLLSVTRALAHVGATPVQSHTPHEVANADRLILPGVGAFGNGVAELAAAGLTDAVLSFAKRGRPFLGICLGMQMMMDSSEEFGMHAGLGLIPGSVVAIPAKSITGQSHKVPHIGWNVLLPGNADWRGTILDGITKASTYFVHSFMAAPKDNHHLLAACDYHGMILSAVIQRDHLYGCQFHPEKSGLTGLKILGNFLKL